MDGLDRFREAVTGCVVAVRGGRAARPAAVGHLRRGRVLHAGGLPRVHREGWWGEVGDAVRAGEGVRHLGEGAA